MSKEQLNFFYDLDKINKINQKIDNIRNDTSLPASTKEEILFQMFDDLDPDDNREYEHFKRTMSNIHEPIKDTTVCQEKYKDKVVLIELVNLQNSYNRMCALFGMIGYLQQRLERYKSDDKVVIEKFFEEIFNGSSDKYMGTIYDLYYKNNKSNKPDFVPEIPPDVVGNLMPSIDQIANINNYMDLNIESIRAVVSGVLGIRAGHEATIHVHGVFDNMQDDEMLKYRNANMNKFNSATELLPIPFGHTFLIDKFRDLRRNIVLFNTSDPEVEILHSNRLTTEMNSHAMFKKRLNKLEGRMSKSDIAAIKEYRSEIDKLSKMPAKAVPKIDQKLAKLREKIDKIHEANTKDTEVITNVIKVSKGKVTKQTYATEATN